MGAESRCPSLEEEALRREERRKIGNENGRRDGLATRVAGRREGQDRQYISTEAGEEGRRRTI